MVQRYHASLRSDVGKISDEDDSGSKIRKAAAIVYFAFVCVFVIAFVVIILVSKKS
jgi:hypothetical protein